LEYTGFDKIEGDSCQKTASAELVIAVNDDTPYWADSINGKEVWKVRFRDIPVGYNYTVMRKRDFEITLELETGRLVKIFSVTDDAGSSDTLPQSSAKAATAFFAKRNIIFHCSPETAFEVPFWEALKSVFIANTAGTKIIKAYLAELDDGRGNLATRWIIILHGIDHPLPASGGYVPEYALNIMMTFVDAETGKAFGAQTGPYDPADYMARKKRK